MENNMTEGSILKSIARFSLPYLLSYFLQTLYGMADLFLIGRFAGVESTTAVSIGSQVMHMLTVMIVGLAMGTTVMTARAVGAKDQKQMNRTVGNTIFLFAMLSLVSTVLMLVTVPMILHILAVPSEAITGTRAYLYICFLGIPFITAYNIISSIFRGMGDSKSPMYFIAIACGVNIVLDYLFIGIMNMQAAGAALGTTLAQSCSVLIALYTIIRKRMIPNLSSTDLKPSMQAMKNILSVGVPIALQDGFIQVSFITITIIANMRGLNDAAAVGVVEKLIGIIFLVPSTMLSTVSALAAQNIGAGEKQRARSVLNYALIICILYGFAVAIPMQFMAEQAVGIFSDSPLVMTLGGQYMRSYVVDTIFASIHFCYSGYFCALGVSIYSFIHNAISIITTRIPLAWITSSRFPDTLYPMGFSAPCGSLLSIAICLGFMHRLKTHNVSSTLQ